MLGMYVNLMKNKNENQKCNSYIEFMVAGASSENENVIALVKKL